MKHINPLTFSLSDENQGKDEAANLIRGKLNNIYANEPDALSQAQESTRPGKHSKHQKFMADLAKSGKPFAQIQTEWHDYYQSLPDSEKHEVWNEFYEVQDSAKPVFAAQEAVKQGMIDPSAGAKHGNFEVQGKPPKPQSVSDLKKQLTSKVRVRGKLSRKQHLKSLMFGLSVGAFSVLLLLFGFFNERFIAPFITPSRMVGNTPLITDGSAVGKDPKLIIPKINVEVPVVYDVETVEEKAVQEGLERGVVHYATTANPGEKGAGAIFGHSSNNILNKGKYKFAFVLLSQLQNDDTFYIEKDGVRYVYRVFDRKVVKPTEVDVLNEIEGKTATMALITCDPPGTTINRLVIYGEQISPDPTTNTASTALQTDYQPTELAGNAESLWQRIWPF